MAGMSESNQKAYEKAYEPPRVRDLGRLEELTKGQKSGNLEEMGNMS
jgi:hypothetical protein